MYAPITNSAKINELNRATESSCPHILFENLERHLYEVTTRVTANRTVALTGDDHHFSGSLVER